ncbi:MAG: ABC transporter permease [Armatimonadetes bacterium]|nr:ABC transporter permease [Armatimonadota bacterium]
MRRLAAIAGLTFRAAFRLRVFWAILALLAVVVCVVPAGLRDDGTLVGRLRLLLTYTLGLSQSLLCIATVWLGAEAIAGEVAAGRIDLLATKPLPRWQFWLGKALGVMLLDAVLVAAVGAGVWLQTVRAYDSREAWSTVLTARHAVRAETPDFDAQAVAALAKRGLAGAGVDRATVRESALHDVLSAWQSVPPGQSKEWRFRGIRPGGYGSLSLRFRFRAGGALGAGGAAGVWRFGSQSLEGRYRPDEFEGVAVSDKLVAADGTLTVTFDNRSGETLVFPVGDGPTVLYQVGGFAGNYLRALLLLWLQLAFLAAVGVALGGALSFPVASFAGLAYLAVALHGSLMASRLDALKALGSTHLLLQTGVKAGVWLTLALHRYWPVNDLAHGLALGRVGEALLVVGVVQIGLVAGAGMLLWSSREPAMGVEA